MRIQVHIRMELLYKALSHLKCATIQQKREWGFRNHHLNSLLTCLEFHQQEIIHQNSTTMQVM
jgi:hypothetical protein